MFTCGLLPNPPVITLAKAATSQEVHVSGIQVSRRYLPGYCIFNEFSYNYTHKIGNYHALRILQVYMCFWFYQLKLLTHFTLPV